MPTPDATNTDVVAPVNGINPEEGNPVILTKRRDFVAAAKSGHKGVASSVIVQMNPKPSYPDQDQITKPQLRYGLTASKKTGNAVCRNRSKRRMRSLVADHLHNHGSIGCDYVLIARHNTASIPYDRLVKDFKYALKKAHQLRENTVSDTVKNTGEDHKRSS